MYVVSKSLKFGRKKSLRNQMTDDHPILPHPFSHCPSPLFLFHARSLRIMDFVDSGTLPLDSVRFFVLDEADRLLDDGGAVGWFLFSFFSYICAWHERAFEIEPIELSIFGYYRLAFFSPVSLSYPFGPTTLSLPSPQTRDCTRSFSTTRNQSTIFFSLRTFPSCIFLPL